jgi:RimJ/RimL family protein N-acetyltransferase
VVVATLHADAPAAEEMETARLRMRLFTPDDLDRMCEITSNPDVTRYIGYGEPLTREETRANLEKIMNGFRRRGYGRWALERRDTGALIGYCGLSSGNPDVGIELAYMLAREEWGRGFAVEAARASLRYGFEALGVESIAGLTFHDNLRSRAVLERVGMKFIRDAHYYDFACVHYAAARADWRHDGSYYRVDGRQ